MTNLHELPQNWQAYMQALDEKPALTRVNMALKDLAPFEGYGYRLQFAVYFKHPQEDGLPTDEEYEHFIALQNLIDEVVQGLDVIDAGVLTWNGRINFFVYAKNIEGIEEKLVATTKAFGDYKTDCWVDEDSEWEAYLDMLYPNPYALQQMQNNRILMALEEQNDQNDKPRNIQHWLYFFDEAKSQAFAEQAQVQGYEVLECETLNDEDGTFYSVSLIHFVPVTQIDEITWALMDLAQEFEGEYDGWETEIAH
ncbi:hypothetical protein A4G20_06260 [Pasteurellaceae bacterium RH1A]|nr:hypothetical protein A4G20_06260 [Pasteurellaceae bacterium RH1A]